MEFLTHRDCTKSKTVELLVHDLLFANDYIEIVKMLLNLQYIAILILLLSGLAQTSA